MWKKLLTVIVLSFLFLLLVDKISQYYIMRYPVLKSSYISQVKQNADIVFHGSCEAEMILNPSYFDSATNYKTFNLGELGSKFPDNYLMLHLYLKYQKKPRCLILHVSPESFEVIDRKPLMSYKYAAFLNDDTVYQVVKEIDPSYIVAVNIPFVKYSYYNIFTLYKIFAGLGYTISKKTLPPFANGFYPPSQGDTLVEDEILHKKIDSYKWNPIEEKYFKKIISLCKQNNIELILYKVPAYYKYYQDNPFLKEYDTRIVEIARQHGLKYLSFEGIPMSKDLSNFYLSPRNLTLKGIPIFNNLFLKQISDSVLHKN